MTEPSLTEINQSIILISSYRDRLIKELIGISQKLQIPKKRADKIIESNKELIKANETLARLELEKKRLEQLLNVNSTDKGIK